jgi:UDP-GlcNAc3NAcA epimerase
VTTTSAASQGRQLNLLVIVGIRSHFIKLAAFQRAVRKWNTDNGNNIAVRCRYVNTGQHYDAQLTRSFIDEFSINFDVDLTGSYKQYEPMAMLGEMIYVLHKLCTSMREDTDWVVVFGDANTTLAASIAAAKARCRVAHIEAGVRTHDPDNPEEINRVVTDRLASAHFTSTRQDVENLVQEGFANTVVHSGDIVRELIEHITVEIGIPKKTTTHGSYILASLHREENLTTPDVLFNVLHALELLGEEVLFILHPRTRACLEQLAGMPSTRIKFTDGLSYREMMTAISQCSFLLTDSGALQREAYYLGKRALVRQDVPFWPVFIDAGVHACVGRESSEILRALKALSDLADCTDLPQLDDLGNSNAGQIVLSELARRSHQRAD